MEERLSNCPLGSECEEVKTENGRQILYRCPWLSNVKGTHPQTGVDLDHWQCGVSLAPLMSIETAKEVRQTGKAIESMRNEMVKGQAEFNNLIRLRQQTKAIGNN